MRVIKCRINGCRVVDEPDSFGKSWFFFRLPKSVIVPKEIKDQLASINCPRVPVCYVDLYWTSIDKLRFKSVSDNIQAHLDYYRSVSSDSTLTPSQKRSKHMAYKNNYVKYYFCFDMNDVRLELTFNSSGLPFIKVVPNNLFGFDYMIKSNLF